MKQRDLYYERIPTKLLREDIRLLGTFLGRVIKDQEGIKFFNIVERLRLLSKNTLLDKNKSKVFSKISKDTRKLSPEITFKVTRAFSHILNLMNLAESLDASRKLNEYDNPYFKNKKQNLFIEDIINNLFKKNIPIILLNGRITKKTFNRWMKFSNFSKFVFSKFNYCLSANEE